MRTAHAGVSQVAVVGRPEADKESVAAFVVRHPGFTFETSDLTEFLQSRLSPYERPTHYFFVETFPVTLSGKVRKPELLILAQKSRNC